MLVSEFLPNFLKVSTNTKDYAKSFAYYLDRKTAVARELREILLGVFRTGALIDETTGEVDTTLMPKQYWHTPVRAILADSHDYTPDTAVFLPAITIARTINGKLMEDESLLYDAPVRYFGADYEAKLIDIAKDVSPDAYAILSGTKQASVLLNLPFACFVGDDVEPVSSVYVTSTTNPEVLVRRDPSTLKDIHVNTFATLSNMCGEVNKTVAISYILSELGSSNGNISITDIRTKLEATLSVDASPVIADVNDIVTMAVDNSTDVEIRINNIVNYIKSEDNVSSEVIEETDVWDSSDFLTAMSSGQYSGTSMKAMWNMANCSGVFDTAFAIVGAVLETAGKLVLAALDGLWSLGSRLWKKYVEPAYISKDFVKTDIETPEEFCDVPSMILGNEQAGFDYDESFLGKLVVQNMSESMYQAYDLSDEKLNITIDYPGSTKSITGLKGFNGSKTYNTPFVKDGNERAGSVQPLTTRTFTLPDYGEYSYQAAIDKVGDLETPEYNLILRDCNKRVIYEDRSKQPSSSMEVQMKYSIYAQNESIKHSVGTAYSFRMSGYAANATFKINGLTYNGIIFSFSCNRSNVSGAGNTFLIWHDQIDHIDYSTSSFEGKSDIEVVDFVKSGAQLAEGTMMSFYVKKTSYDSVLVSSAATTTIKIYTKAGHIIPIKLYVSPHTGSAYAQLEPITMTVSGKTMQMTPKVSGVSGYKVTDNSMARDPNYLLYYDATYYESAKCVANFYVDIPIYGVTASEVGSDICIYDNHASEAFRIYRLSDRIRFKDDSEIDIPCGVSISSNFNSGLSRALKIPKYSVDIDVDYVLGSDSDCKMSLSTIVDLDAMWQHSSVVNYMSDDVSRVATPHSANYDGDATKPHFKWSDNCSTLEWWSIPISDMSEDDIKALVHDINNPIDKGCACVSRYRFGVIQVLNSKDNNLYSTINLCPINHECLLTNTGLLRFRKVGEKYVEYNYEGEQVTEFSSSEAFYNRFLEQLSKSYTVTTDYSVGDEDDRRAYKDLFAAKIMFDLYAYSLCNPKADIDSRFNSNGVWNWFLFNSSTFSPAEYNNEAFINMLYKDGVTDNAVMFMYAYLLQIITNKTAYMRLYFMLFGDTPRFFPYLIGDRLQMPKWHISTDDELQTYVDRLCAGIVVAVLVIAAVIIIGVAAVKIRKAFTLKMNARNEIEQATRLDNIALRRNGTVLDGERSNVIKQLKKVDKDKDPAKFAELTDKLKGLNTSIAENNKKIKAGAEALFKQQKVTKRWTAFASIFGVGLTNADKAKDATSDFDLNQLLLNEEVEDQTILASGDDYVISTDHLADKEDVEHMRNEIAGIVVATEVLSTAVNALGQPIKINIIPNR